MRARVILVLLVGVCAAVLAAEVATANRLAYTEQIIRSIYNNNFIIASSIGGLIRCSVTIERTVHGRTIAKTAGALIGYINRASKGSCGGGEMRFNTETLPWHSQYSSFSGTLPNIIAYTEAARRMSLEVNGEAFGLRVTCRYTIPSKPYVDNRETRGTITSESLGSESASSETLGCPSITLTGTASVTNSGGGTVVVTLV